jgi:hypothetical protein
MSIPPSYLIIGGGYFGSRAAEQLLKKNLRSKILVVDRNKAALKRVSSLPVETGVSDGLAYLGRSLLEDKPFNYIIPAVPSHLAFEFILSRLEGFGAKRGRVPPLSGLPNPVKGKTGDLYTTVADFLCPEDCPGPSPHCTVTRGRRENPLYQMLKDLKGSFESKVIISEQLLPGVGGFRPNALLALLEAVRKLENSACLVLVSTASSCHAVTSALKFI